MHKQSMESRLAEVTCGHPQKLPWGDTEKTVETAYTKNNAPTARWILLK